MVQSSASMRSRTLLFAFQYPQRVFRWFNVVRLQRDLWHLRRFNTLNGSLDGSIGVAEEIIFRAGVFQYPQRVFRWFNAQMPTHSHSTAPQFQYPQRVFRWFN